jgi:NADP-dependent 3-hydroxy acid dehydrogenase YdfG
LSRTHSALDQLHYQYGSEQVEVLAEDLSKDFGLGKKAVELAVGRWGRLDALVVNHGGLDPVKKVADSSAEEWRESFDGNVFSAVGLVSLHYLLFGGLGRGKWEAEKAV